VIFNATEREVSMSVSIPKEHLAVLTETDVVLQQFKAFMTGDNTRVVINSEEEYSAAAAVIKTLKLHKKKVEDSKNAVVTPLYAVYKDTLAEFTPVIKSIDDKVQALESAGRVFRAKVAEEARQKQIEADRIAAEERRKAEEKAAAERAKEEAYREQGRDDLADKAAERAERAEEKASCTVAPVITPNIPQNSRGTFCTTKRFAGRIKRVKLLLEYFAAHEEAFPANAKAELEKWLSAQARAAKSTNCPYPGAEYYEVL